MYVLSGLYNLECVCVCVCVCVYIKKLSSVEIPL